MDARRIISERDMLHNFLLAQIPATEYSVDEVLSPYIYVFYVAFLISFFFTPAMQSVATHYGIIDAPDNKRKMHNTPVAYLGGVAVFLGWISGLAISQFLQLHRTEPGLLPHLRVPSFQHSGIRSLEFT